MYVRISLIRSISFRFVSFSIPGYITYRHVVSSPDLRAGSGDEISRHGPMRSAHNETPIEVMLTHVMLP